MAVGTKLMIVTFYAFAATTLLVICIAAPAIIYLTNSGQPLCVPRLSIRCHESDCGRFFQPCGSKVLLEVPEHKVCYQGALLSVSRNDLHSCPSRTTIPRNLSQPAQHTRLPGLGACDCSLCTYPQNCQCLCTQRVNVRSPVTCQNRKYPSLAAAISVGVPAKLCYKTGKRSIWELALEAVQASELSIGQWSLRDFAESFTFQPPFITDGLEGTCSCYISSSCSTQCQG